MYVCVCVCRGVCCACMQKLTSPYRGFDFAQGGKGGTGTGRGRMRVLVGANPGPPAGGQRRWLDRSDPFVGGGWDGKRRGVQGRELPEFRLHWLPQPPNLGHPRWVLPPAVGAGGRAWRSWSGPGRGRREGKGWKAAGSSPLPFATCRLSGARERRCNELESDIVTQLLRVSFFLISFGDGGGNASGSNVRLIERTGQKCWCVLVSCS